ncbi:prolyl oligopeptidase [Marchantia polymorpha subsp. ruderalis]
MMTPQFARLGRNTTNTSKLRVWHPSVAAGAASPPLQLPIPASQLLLTPLKASSRLWSGPRLASFYPHSASLICLHLTPFGSFHSHFRGRCQSTFSTPLRRSMTMGSLAVAPESLHYPDVRRDESIVDNYHGTLVADPYRWLEDPESAETKDFVEIQSKLTASVLDKCKTKEKLKERITALYDYAKYDCPLKQGNKYFYMHNTGLQPQSVFYMQDSLEAEPEVLLDPNTLSEDGTVSLSQSALSEDGTFLACGISASGSDWVNIKYMRVADKKFQSDVLSWVKFSSITWTHDHKGFFYSRYPAPKEGVDAGTETEINLYHELYYHFLGSDQSEDILCWKDSDNAKWLFGSEVTDDGKYLLLTIEEGCDPVNRLYYCDLTSLPAGLEGFRGSTDMLPFQKLVDNFDAQYTYVANDGSVFTFTSNKDAPKCKVTRVDLENPTVWTDIIPESETDVLSSATCVNEQQLVVCYLSDVKHVLQVRDLQTGNFLYQLPLDIGSVSSVSGRREEREIFFRFTSFLNPGTIFRCNLAAVKPVPEVFRDTEVKDFDRDAFETKQVFASSKDGTRVPMFIVSKKGTILNGDQPTLLYGYGGFNISLTPYFSASRLALVRHHGAVFAMANIRGGGEYGEDWHKAGSLSKKQNCFDDFQACAEYLISEGYTQPKKLCIEGGSNGGLLVAACVNQRPELYGCALAHVGVMDMLRFHKFTIGHAWTSDYGCSDKAEDFEWLVKYSPLHNVRRPWEGAQNGRNNVQYPAMMLLTADHDDRVVPLHSLKLLATLQYELCKKDANSPQTNYIIARIDSKAGHGAGRPTQKIIDQTSDAFSFFAMVTEAPWIE